MSGTETMTSRDRLQRALNHEVPDRVPLDLGGFQTGIHKRAYSDLLEYLDIEDEIRIEKRHVAGHDKSMLCSGDL